MERQVQEARDWESGGTAGFWGMEDGCETIRQGLMAKDIFDILNSKQERMSLDRACGLQVPLCAT